MRPVLLRPLLAALAAPLAVPLALVIAPPAAALSCVGPEDILGASARVRPDQVFRGRVVDAVRGEIVVAVTEVWSGGPVDSKVRLQVDLPGWSSWNGRDGRIQDGYHDDRDWVFAVDRENDIPTVGPCSAWATDEIDVLRYRPSRTTRPVAVDHAVPARDSVDAEGASIWPAAVGLGAAALLAPLLVVLSLRRRGGSG
jgi:hypothetical protein